MKKLLAVFLYLFMFGCNVKSSTIEPKLYFSKIEHDQINLVGGLNIETTEKLDTILANNDTIAMFEAIKKAAGAQLGLDGISNDKTGQLKVRSYSLLDSNFNSIRLDSKVEDSLFNELKAFITPDIKSKLK